MADKNYLDSDGVLYLWQKIKAKITDAIKNKVDKVDGKGLSTNDYTTAEKTKLARIATNANNYSHPTSSGNKHIPSGGSSGQILRWSADGTAVWGEDNNTTYKDFGFATNTVDGARGLVPAPQAKDHSGLTMLSDTGWRKIEIFNADLKNGGAGIALGRRDGDVTLVDVYTELDVATTSRNGVMSKDDKIKLDNLPSATALSNMYAKKSDITGVYKYRGSVATEDKLPTSGQTTGDVYDIVAASSYGAAGMNVAWNGKAWDALGEKFQISAITNTWMDTNLT